MKRPVIVMTLVCLLAASVVTTPASASSHRADNQIVEGEILIADPKGSGFKQCDGVVDGYEDPPPVQEGLSGVIGVTFPIERSTRGYPFVLEPLDAPGANLDIHFYLADGDTRYFVTVLPGGERGIVPRNAERAYVCLSEGSRVSFQYQAGGSVEPPAYFAEADLALHSENLHLRAHPRTEWGFKRMVFQGRIGVASSANVGLGIYRLLDRAPYVKQLSTFRCRGGNTSADISIWGDYVFQSVPDEYPYFPWSDQEVNRGRSPVCNDPNDSYGKAGIRVVDISDLRHPKQVAFLEVACGSMNHTLVPDGRRLYIYTGIPCAEGFKMPEETPDHRLRAFKPFTFQMKVIRFNQRHPQWSRIVSEPTLIGPRDPGHVATTQLGCHDITVFPAKDLAVCPQYFNEVGRTSLLDISDRSNPEVIAHLPMPPESSWMSHASFSWDGNYVTLLDTGRSFYALADALNQCSQGPQEVAGMWIYDISNPAQPERVSEFTLPRSSADPINPCAPWEINMIPTKDPNRRVAVVGWNAGGMTVVDLSHPEDPREIAYWRPHPGSQITGSYFYNGLIYSVEYWTGGIRVFELDGFNEKTAKSYRTRMNPQTQLVEFGK